MAVNAISLTDSVIIDAGRTHTVQILETKDLDLLSQTQGKCGGTEAVYCHPCISGVEG
jgi:hypothetical protein